MEDGIMEKKNGNKYFEYMKMAKEEFERILQNHLELERLSAREMRRSRK